MNKKLSLKTASYLLIAAGIVFLILAAVGYNNISKLGLTPEQYDTSRDIYLNMMFGGGRASSGNFFTDLVMDRRVSFLWLGIAGSVLGCVGAVYSAKHPEKNESSASQKNRPVTVDPSQPAINRQNSQGMMSNMPQKEELAAKAMIAIQNSTGLKKVSIILAIAASACFVLGVGILPYSLLSIAAGISLLYVLWKRSVVKTYMMLLPVILFMARFLVSENSYSGYDWITVLYRVLGYGEIALIFILNWGAFRFIELEDDDIHLLSRFLVILSLTNAAFASIEFFRGFSYGFSLVMFRLGSIPFWLVCGLYYIYAQKPVFQSKADIYAGKQPHPYHTISGSVQYFMAGIYAVALTCFIAGPWLIVYYWNMMMSTARSGLAGYAVARALSGLTLWVMITCGGVLILAGLFLLWLNRKLRLRRPSFLLYYEYACFVVVIVSIVTIFCGQVLLGVILTIVSVAVSYTTLKWLTTSVRVRTYMGTDQYLRVALFTRKIPSPIPADRAAVQCQEYSRVVDGYEEEWEEVPSNTSEDEWEVVDNTAQNDEWEMITPTAANIQLQQKVYVQPNCCCICGNSLFEGYAVLFTFMSGDEARIDRRCHEQVSIAVNGSNPLAQSSAKNYLWSRLGYVDPAVANYLSTILQRQ